MHALIALIQVQLHLYLKNRKALIIHLLMPMLIAAFFGSLFGGGGKDSAAQIRMAWVDEDRSPLSEAIHQAMAGDEALQLQVLSRVEAQALVRQGKLPVALILPAGFGEQAGRALLSGAKAEAEVLYDPSDRMSVNLLRGLFAQYAMRETLVRSFSSAQSLQEVERTLQQAQGLPTERRRQLLDLFGSLHALQKSDSAKPGASAASAAQQAMGQTLSLPYVLREQALSAGVSGYNGYAHSFAGMGVQFVLMLGVELGVGLLLARRSGMWQRLRAAPLSRATLLAAHFLSTALIASAVLTLVMLAGMLVFGFTVQGSWLGWALIVLSYGAFTAGFGLLLAAIGGSPEATRGLAIMVTLLMVMLGGAWVPSFVFPRWLQDLTLVVPVRWAVDGLDAMTWRGLDLGAALGPVAVLAGSALALAGLAVWRFRWRE